MNLLKADDVKGDD